MHRIEDFESMSVFPIVLTILVLNRDWRSPAVVSQYSNILKIVATKYGIPFIDTNMVIAPVWDSAHDWCHFNHGIAGLAGKEEARYILAKIFGLF